MTPAGLAKRMLSLDGIGNTTSLVPGGIAACIAHNSAGNVYTPAGAAKLSVLHASKKKSRFTVLRIA
jgi:hypothetical protein